jgi:hypothetical protein
MPHDRLSAYLERVEKAVAGCRDAYVERFEEEIVTPERANLRVRIRYRNGRLLEINEAVIVEAETLSHLDYRYHCQDAAGNLLFRYDSTPHFPELPSFPQHKHQGEGVVGASRPDISQVLNEAQSE